MTFKVPVDFLLTKPTMSGALNDTDSPKVVDVIDGSQAPPSPALFYVEIWSDAYNDPYLALPAVEFAVGEYTAANQFTLTRPNPMVHAGTPYIGCVFRRQYIDDITDYLAALTAPVDLPVTIPDGGTGQTGKTAAFDALSPLSTLGDVVTHDGTHSIRLPGSISATRRFLSQTGDGAASALPLWTQPQVSDIEDFPTPVIAETPSGDVDGVNADFTVAHTPKTGFPVYAYRNGLREGFSISGSVVTMDVIPQATPGTPDEITVDYWW